MNFKISVLIPAYNAEKTIQKTLDSIVMQSTSNYEVIIINDGSKDGTQEILEKYKKKYSNFKIYFQENKGVAVTRQKLVELATGTHLLFCDADDYMERNAIQNIIRILNNHDCDLILYGYRLIDTKRKKNVLKRELAENQYCKNECGEYHVKGLADLYWSALWNKCYKKEIIKNVPELKFQRLIEDVIFNVEYMERCESIYICEQILYNYVQIGDSLTRGKKQDSSQNIIESFNTFKYLYQCLKKTYPTITEKSDMYIYINLLDLCDRAKKIKDLTTYSMIKKSQIFKKVSSESVQVYGKVIIKRAINKIKTFVKSIIE